MRGGPQLAQRNLQITASDNPGAAATHLIPQTFDLRPTANIGPPAGVLASYPDELMIDWGNTPANSTASIYWPQVLAADVIATASALYSSHQLTASDPHTIQCPVTGGVTYVPIPQGTGQSLAGLLTVDLPPTVVAGQEFDVVLRRVRSRQPIQLQLMAEESDVAEPPAAPARRARSRGRRTEGQLDAPVARKRHVPQETNWRYVTGAFQVKIPVSKAPAILPQERDTLAIFKWRLLQTSPTSRWYPVLQRYVDLVAARVGGLGGDPGAIAPSPDGAPQPTHEKPSRTTTGMVLEVRYDCAGHIDAFVLGGCCERAEFRASEPGLSRILLQAMRHRLRVTVTTCPDEPHHVESVSVRP